MVSYTRARAEALGVECKVGLATRPVRVVIISIGLVFARGASLGHFQLLAPAVYVLAGLTRVDDAAAHRLTCAGSSEREVAGQSPSRW